MRRPCSTADSTAGSTARNLFSLGAIVWIAAEGPAAVRGHTPPATSTDASATSRAEAFAERGLIAAVIVRDAPKPIRAKPDQPLTAPILVVRVTALPADGAASTAGAYRVEYIGAVAGEYDLRDWLEFLDGTPATSLAPLPVTVESQLPDNHGSDLFSVPAPSFRLESHYRTIVIALAALWLSVPLIVFTRRWLRRPAPAAPAPPTPQPTLADLLRPLIERARGEGLSIREQGQLELLLVHFWRHRLGMGDMTPAETLAHIRRHAEAGELLRAVERWLHAPGAGAARPDEDISELLRPYAEVPVAELAGDANEPSGDRRSATLPVNEEVRR